MFYNVQPNQKISAICQKYGLLLISQLYENLRFEGGGGGEIPPGGNQNGENVGSIGNDAEGYRSEAYSFDSTALERAAKAAKVLCLLFKD